MVLNQYHYLKKALEGAKTVVWNGPMGVAEFKNYSTGTLEIAKAISKLDSCYSVVGGGDSVALQCKN